MRNFHVRSGKRSIHHYHIRWSEKAELDWERHGSRVEAQESAAQLVRPGETYTIEERDETCPRCWNAFLLNASLRLQPRVSRSHEPEATDPDRKYPWQRAVAEAFQSPRKNLPLKFNAAQRAISARLCDKTPADLNEQIAIREALQSLNALLPETSPKQTGELESEAKDREESA